MREMPAIDSVRITPELFVIPHAGQFIVYAPLKGVALLANRAFVSKLSRLKKDDPTEAVPEPAFIDHLLTWGLIEVNGESSFPPLLEPDAFAPTDLVILTTASCNLRCTYCYASAGERQQPFDSRVAEAAVRFIVENAFAHDVGECGLAFHGGGEPTLALPFIKHCVKFARQYARSMASEQLHIVPSLATNGFLTPQQIDWLAANMHSIQVSLDGPSDIHNEQRPLVNGRPTFNRVFNTVRRCEELGVPDLLVKATISNKHVARMAEITRFLCESFRLNRFHLGPVMDVGRSLETGYCEPSVDEFIAGAEEARKVAASYGKEIVVSLALETFPNARYTFCGLTDPNFAVTIEGRVSGCYQVIYADDARSSFFHYGEYDAVGDRFVLDADRVRELRRRDVTHLSRCRDCFARWQCAGDCQARWYDPGTGDELPDWPDFRCQVNRELVRRELVRVLETTDGAPTQLKGNFDGSMTCT